MSINWRTDIDTALWAAALAFDPAKTAITAGRQIHETTVGNSRAGVASDAAKFPQLQIECVDDRPDKPVQTFAMVAVGANATNVGNPVMPQTVTYRLTLTFDSLDLVKNSPIEMAVDRGFASAWPKFGLAYVFPGQLPRKVYRTTDKGTAAGTIRRVIEYTITLNLRLRLNDITAA